MTSYYPDAIDLTRCEHGKPEGGYCQYCPNETSTGNPLLQPGQHIGYNQWGYKIIVPLEAGDRDEPRKWVVRVARAEHSIP